MKIPDVILSKIQELSSARGYDYKELLQEYNDILSDSNLSLITFGSDDEKYEYAFKVLLSRTLDSVPTKTYTIIPVGFSGLRKTKEKGVLIRNIFAVILDKKPKIRRIVCSGNRAYDIVNNIELFNKYKIRLGEFNDGTLTITNRSKFINPEPIVDVIDHDIIWKFMRKLGVERTNIKNAKKYQSRVGSTGYIDDTDWKVIRGFIVKEYIGDRKDGTKFASCTIVDDSVPFEDKVLPDGTVIPPGFTVWVAPEFLKWYGECDFYGTISLDNNGEPFMNAYCVVGVYATPK